MITDAGAGAVPEVAGEPVEYYSVATAARLLRRTPTTVRTWIAEGRLAGGSELVDQRRRWRVEAGSVRGEIARLADEHGGTEAEDLRSALEESDRRLEVALSRVATLEALLAANEEVVDGLLATVDAASRSRATETASLALALGGQRTMTRLLRTSELDDPALVHESA